MRTKAQNEARARAKAKEVRDLLKKFAKIINDQGHPYAKHLWDIVSALRGPDFERYAADLKEQTTERIRHIIGLKPFMFFTNSNPLILDADLMNKLNKQSSHFADHIDGAVQALKALGYPQ